MSLSNSKCWYSNNCLHFLKRTVPFSITINKMRLCLVTAYRHIECHLWWVANKPFMLSVILMSTAKKAPNIGVSLRWISLCRVSLHPLKWIWNVISCIGPNSSRKMHRLGGRARLCVPFLAGPSFFFTLFVNNKNSSFWDGFYNFAYYCWKNISAHYFIYHFNFHIICLKKCKFLLHVNENSI